MAYKGLYSIIGASEAIHKDNGDHEVYHTCNKIQLAENISEHVFQRSKRRLTSLLYMYSVYFECFNIRSDKLGRHSYMCQNIIAQATNEIALTNVSWSFYTVPVNMLYDNWKMIHNESAKHKTQGKHLLYHRKISTYK